MTYLDLLCRQPADTLALITPKRRYTYGQLCAAARRLRRGIPPGTGCVRWIRESSISRQLLAFLACSGTRAVPVLAPPSGIVLPAANEAPPRACMGVLTSGSTGRSRLLWRDYASWADFFPVQNRVFGITAQTVLFCQGSLAFTGNLNMYLGVFAAGGTVVAADSLHPRAWLAQMAACGVNALYLLPVKLRLLAQAARRSYPGVTQIVSGSQPMDCRQARQLGRVFPRARLTLYYGASEAGYITYIRGDEMTEDATLVGTPFPGVTVSVEAGSQAICAATAGGVLGSPQPLILSDCGHIDTAGRLHLLGRRDGQCRIHGVSVHTSQTEQAIMQIFPGAEAAVLPVQTGTGLRLDAYISGIPPAPYREIAARLRPLLPEQALPRRVVFLPALPRMDSGKTDYQALAAMADKRPCREAADSYPCTPEA